MNDQLPVLNIDPEFRRLVSPLSVIFLRRLENSILKHDYEKPIVTWNNNILEGFEQYEICLKHDISFKIDELKFASRYDAMLWIISEQLERNDLKEETRRYLIGKRFVIDSIIDNVPSLDEIPINHVKRIRMQHHNPSTFYLANKYHVGASTVSHYAQYAKAIDYIGEFLPDFASDIVYGNIRISIKNVLSLSKEPISDIRREIEMLKRERIANTPKKDFPVGNKPVSSIKDMPNYDPDAYVMSLAFTIPTWIQSIEKARANTEIEKISRNAKMKLFYLLDELIGVSSKMLLDLEDKRK